MKDDVVRRGEAEISADAGVLPMRVRDALAPAATSPPVATQQASRINAAKLTSAMVVVAPLLSDPGSATRIWKLAGLSANVGARIGLGLAAIVLILAAWTS